MTFFSCRLLTTPIFLRRLSSVHSQFSHTKLILGRVSPPPPGDATGNWLTNDAVSASSMLFFKSSVTISTARLTLI